MSNNPNPQFGVPLTPNQINPELPFSVEYGVTPDNKYVPIAVNESGQLSIGDVTFSGSITVSNVTIQGVDPTNSNTPENISVVNWGINGYALRTSIFYQGNPLLINTDGSINVNLISDGNPTTNLNTYVENDVVTPSSITTLFTYTVQNSTTYLLNGFIGWGTYDGVWIVSKNGTQVGGGCSSPSQRTIQINYGSTPIIGNAGDIITIAIQNYAMTTQTFNLNVLAELAS